MALLVFSLMDIRLLRNCGYLLSYRLDYRHRVTRFAGSICVSADAQRAISPVAKRVHVDRARAALDPIEAACGKATKAQRLWREILLRERFVFLCRTLGALFAESDVTVEALGPVSRGHSEPEWFERRPENLIVLNLRLLFTVPSRSREVALHTSRIKHMSEPKHRRNNMAAIKAITFDLWDTIVRDDSDEPKRKRQGLRSKRAERRHLLWQALNELEPIDYENVSLAYDVADAGFNITWREEHINWRLEQRLRVVLNGLHRTLPDAAFDYVAERTGAMEVELPPDLVDGVAPALDTLSRRYRLAICSDAIVTPGAGLRKLLQHYDLKRYFSAFAFSDEVGRSKPDVAMFEAAASQLGVQLDEIVHIGDRDHNDVKGPQAIGAKAVLFTASRPDDRNHTTAEAICNDYTDLPDIIERLADAAAA